MVTELLGWTPHVLWGGYPGAERRMCCHIPDYLEETWLTEEDGPVVALRATYFPGDELTHRDFLGSLMGEGIKRETVGDILVGKGQCDLLTTREMAPYLLQNWLSAGRTKFHLEQIPLDALTIPHREVKEVRGTVATLRLDGVIAEGFGISRGKSSGYIATGKVTINGLACEKADKQVAEGDVLALRGMGKLLLSQVGGTTKKGRISLIFEKYQ